MKSLEARFKNIESKNPLWSSLICFNEACKGCRFTDRTISEWFPKLVDKEDYSPGQKNALIKFSKSLKK